MFTIRRFSALSAVASSSLLLMSYNQHSSCQSGNSSVNLQSKTNKVIVLSDEFDDEKLISLRPKSEYKRIDHMMLTMPKMLAEHAIHEALAGEEKVDLSSKCIIRWNKDDVICSNTDSCL